MSEDNIWGLTKDEILDMRIELADKITCLNRDDKDLFEFSNMENDFVVLSSRNDGFPVKGLTRVSLRLDQLTPTEMTYALLVSEEYFKEVKDEMYAIAGE